MTALTVQETTGLRREYFNRLQLFKGIPFWIDDPKQHEKEFNENIIGDPEISDWSFCCFNHAIGCPITPEHNFNPLFDYQIRIFNKQIVENYKKIFILKARGIGISEYFLRLMAWLCLRNDKLRWSQMMIITGMRIHLARDLVTRMKLLFFPRLKITFPYETTVLYLNGVKIVGYPAYTVHTARGQPNVSFVLVDEADFFPISTQMEIRNVIEGYVPKSNPYIALISTPYEPNGLFQKIENEPEDVCMYYRFRYDWTVSKNKILKPEDVYYVKRTNPETFNREFMLQYGFITGRILEDSIINMMKELGQRYKPHNSIYHPPYVSRATEKILFADSGYTEVSGFATVILEYLPEYNNIRVIHCEQEDRSDPIYMVNKIHDLHKEYNLSCIYVDAADQGMVNALRKVTKRDPTDHAEIERIKKMARDYKQNIEEYLFVNDFVFSNRKREILSHGVGLCSIEGRVSIDADKFPELIEELQTAKKKKGKLEKTESNHFNRADAFLGGLFYFELK